MFIDLEAHLTSVDLIADAYKIAADSLSKRGLIPRDVESYDPLLDTIVEEFRSGVRNKIRLADRVIVRFEDYHRTKVEVQENSQIGDRAGM
jgi:hypothetical protein